MLWIFLVIRNTPGLGLGTAFPSPLAQHNMARSFGVVFTYHTTSGRLLEPARSELKHGA